MIPATTTPATSRRFHPLAALACLGVMASAFVAFQDCWGWPLRRTLLVTKEMQSEQEGDATKFRLPARLAVAERHRAGVEVVGPDGYALSPRKNRSAVEQGGQGQFWVRQRVLVLTPCSKDPGTGEGGFLVTVPVPVDARTCGVVYGISAVLLLLALVMKGQRAHLFAMLERAREAGARLLGSMLAPRQTNGPGTSIRP